VVEEQHRLLLDRRRAVLVGQERPGVWERVPERRDALVAAAGEGTVDAAERAVTLACIDRAWRDHLAYCADLREGIHLVRVGGQDPLTVFTGEAIRAFSGIGEEIDDIVLSTLATIRVAGPELDLTAAEIKGPSSTWTYLVNDDPFRDRIGAMLTGPGGTTIAIFSAAMMMPLLIVWGLVDTLLRRRPRRRSDLFGG
jgi:preprotein translocase subunit SecA